MLVCQFLLNLKLRICRLAWEHRDVMLSWDNFYSITISMPMKLEGQRWDPRLDANQKNKQWSQAIHNSQ